MTASELIDQLIANTPDWRGRAIAQIRQVAHQADPEIVEEWKWMGSPVFSRGGIVCVVTLLKNKVKLTFAEGARLADPDRLFNAGLEGNKWRAIDIDENYRIDERGLADLIRTGIAYNVAKAEAAAEARRARKQGQA